jgi:hyperosmotically inducible periplasmic protein
MKRSMINRMMLPVLQLLLKELPITTIKRALPLLLLTVLAGCAPYALAVKETYDVATDPRSVLTQATDTQAEVQIKAALLASPVRGTSGIDVYCRQGVVVLVGVVPPGSQAGDAAVSIARQTSGVRRVETYFVPSRPSWESDLAIKEQIRATLIADPALVSGRADIAVFAGHVVLIGVVNSQASVQRFISDAQSVPGVVSVTSYIQLI